MFALVPEFIAEKARHGRNAGRLAASSLSVDISGFTHLTESLVRHGKGGAEVLAGALRTVFAPLIADVYRQGGFVANFVGDGFTALFPHAHDEDRMRLQALAAAWSICKQAANRVLIATPFGEFRFPIKAVLAEGMVDWTIWKSERIWGEQSAAFLFTGDGITDCMSGDAVAQPGEVVLSALAAQSLRRLLGEQAQLVSLGGPQPRFRLAGLSGTLPEPGKLPSKAKLDSAPFYSQSQFDSRSPGEFRPTLSMFLHLKQAPHAQFMEKMFQVLALYDGYLCRLDPHPLPESGPRLVLFWGAPTSHERDVERGLDFILDLRRAGGIPLRTGITYEVAFSGFVGAPQRQEFTCYGSRVNLAARQMDAAGWDEIWLDEQTVSRVSPAFETETPFERRFKGFSQPRPIYRLVGRREVRLAPKYPGRLVGRESALSDLQTALLPVLDGRFAGVITLRGETGSGKSRLAHTLLHTWPGAQACQVFVAQSDEVVSRSLGPLRTLLRRRFGLLNMQDAIERHDSFLQYFEALLAGLTNPYLIAELQRTRSFLAALVNVTLPDSLYEQLEPELRLQNSFAALKSYLLAESLRRPLILFLEDIHGLDADSWDFLSYLIRNVDDYPLALLITIREGPESAQIDPARLNHGIQQLDISLTPLDEEAIGELTEALLGSSISPDLKSSIIERAEGNPFFAEQISLYLLAHQLLEPTKQGLVIAPASPRLPATVQSILMARLDRLESEVRRVVQTAAVLGREFNLLVLREMLPDESQLLDHIRRADEAGIWSELMEFRYMFRHALMREAAYEMQMESHLRQLHLNAARAIEKIFLDEPESTYTQLAYHYRSAALHEQEKKYLRLAGEVAAARFSNDEALALFNRALELMPDNPTQERFELLQARERVLDVLGDRAAQEQTLKDLEAIADQLVDPICKTHTLLRSALFYERIGKYESARQAAEEAVECASQDPNLVAEAFLRQGIATTSLGLYSAAKQTLKRGLSIAKDAGNDYLEAEILRQLGILAYYEGDYATADSVFQDSLEILRRLGNPRGEASALNNLGARAARQGDMKLAGGYFRQALEIRERIGDRQAVSATLQNLANIALYQTDYAEAQRIYQKALELKRETADRQGEGDVLHNLGIVAVDVGDFQNAEARYEQALEVRRAVDDPRGISMTLGNLGQLRHWQGRHLEGLELNDKAARLARKLGDRSNEAFAHVRRGYILLELGRVDEAAEAFEQSLDLRRKIDEKPRVIESQIGLIALATQQAKLESRREDLETVLDYIEEHGLDSLDQIAQSGYILYQALNALGDRRAWSVIETTHRLLMEQAAHIDEPARNAFLENLPPHRDLIAAYQNLQKPTRTSSP